MGDYTVSISSKLISSLTRDEEKPKPKKTKKPLKTKSPPHTSNGGESPIGSIGRLPLPQQQPLFLPIPLAPPPPPANSELEAIQAVVLESEQAVERMKMREKEMIQELTARAKELHEKEFKLPQQKPAPCLSEKDACLECYREHAKDPLRGREWMGGVITIKTFLIMTPS